MKGAFPERLSQTFCIALRTCVCAVAMAWPLAAMAQIGGVYSGQSLDGTDMIEVSALIEDIQFTATPNQSDCGRVFYLRGTIRHGTTGADRGSISGTMLRCTTKQLQAKCGLEDFYPIPFDATYVLNATGTLQITTRYSMQWWNLTDCKLSKPKNGSALLTLKKVAPSSPNGSPSTFQQIIDKVKRSIIDPHHIFTQ
jgi:hypothetical protein